MFFLLKNNTLKYLSFIAIFRSFISISDKFIFNFKNLAIFFTGFFSRDGAVFACGNRHGRVQLFGFGSRHAFAVSPPEQFFSGDYRLDECAEGVLVDSSGRRYRSISAGSEKMRKEAQRKKERRGALRSGTWLNLSAADNGDAEDLGSGEEVLTFPVEDRADEGFLPVYLFSESDIFGFSCFLFIFLFY